MWSHIFLFGSLPRRRPPEFTAILMFEFWRKAKAASVPGLLCQSGHRRPENVSILSSLVCKRPRALKYINISFQSYSRSLHERIILQNSRKQLVNNQLYLRPLLWVPEVVTYEIFWLHNLSQRRGSDRLFRKLWSHFYSSLIFSFSMFSGSKTTCTQGMLSALWVTYLQAKNTFCNRKIRSVDGTESSLVEALHTFPRWPHDDENAENSSGPRGINQLDLQLDLRWRF